MAASVARRRLAFSPLKSEISNLQSPLEWVQVFASRSEALTVAVGFSPRTEQPKTSRRGATPDKRRSPNVLRVEHVPLVVLDFVALEQGPIFLFEGSGSMMLPLAHDIIGDFRHM